MKYSITALFVLLAILSANCQTKYQEAYIVTNGGDTLNGYINCKEWGNTPTSFRFRSSSSDIIVCSTDNTQYVWIKGVDSFRRFDANISMGKADAAEQRNTPDTAAVDTTIFMKVLATGPKVSLYSFSDKIKTRYFIKQNNVGDVEELVYAKYFFYDKLVTFEKYKTQLLNIAVHYQSNTRSFVQILQTATYAANPIMKAVAYINGREYRKRSRTAIRPYAGISAAYSFTRYSHNDLPFPSGYGFSSPERNRPCYSAKVDLGLDFIFNPLIRKMLFRIDLGFLPARYETTKWDDAHKGYVSVGFHQYTFSFTPQLLYNFYNSEKLGCNIGLGLTANISFYNQENWDENYNTGNIVGGSHVNSFHLSMQPFWMSLPVRAGVVLVNKYDIYFQYNHPLSAVDNLVNFDIKVYSFQLGVNYLF